MRKYLVVIFWLGVMFFPLLFLKAQEPPKKISPAQEAKDVLAKIKANARFGQSNKDILDSLAALQEINNDLAATHNQLKLLMIHRDPAVRREVARTMADISRTSDNAPDAVICLIKLLDDMDVEVRVGVLEALARFGPHAKSAAPGAVKEIKNEDPRIRRGAILLIGNLAPEQEELIPHLIAALDDTDAGTPSFDNSVSMLAMLRLQACKEAAKQAVPKLTQLIKNDKKDEFYRFVALRTLIKVEPEHPLPIATAMALLKSKYADEMIKGAAILTDLGPHGRAAIPDLIAILRMPPLENEYLDRRVKSNVLSAFGAMRSAAKEVLPLLRPMLDTRDSYLRGSVNQAIENIERTK